MEQMKKGRRNSKLLRSFILYVFSTFLFVVSVSAAVIWGCGAIQNRLLPESDEVFLNIEQTGEDGSTLTAQIRLKIGDELGTVPSPLGIEKSSKYIVNSKYSVTSIESSFTSLSPQRQLLYRGCTIAMVALPAVLSLSGILFCGFLFYKKKLKTPIELLADATDKISVQDLDFELSYESGDELGALCRSFEQMREALRENNQRLWEMLEERKQLQASVAHDLRNPIAIIEGHAEYLKLNLPEGNLSVDKISDIAGNIEKAAKRLENYTESIRTINHLEELEVIDRKPTHIFPLFDEITDDLAKLVEPYEISLEYKNNVKVQTLKLDSQVLYRVLENLVSNAVRYAKSKIEIACEVTAGTLTVTVSDDGCGFPDKVLQSKYNYIPTDSTNGEHIGMGLMICRILCKKHGGSLILGNANTGGAVVKIVLSV